MAAVGARNLLLNFQGLSESNLQWMVDLEEESLRKMELLFPGKESWPCR